MALALELSTSWHERFHREGFAIIDGVLPSDQVARLIEVTRIGSSTASDAVLERGGEVYGVRDLIWRLPEIRRLARSPELLEIVEAILGPGAVVVRGLFFDKTVNTNWNLPWHQDLTIAVCARRDVPGFGPWTVKAGIPHVHAPANLLERMVTFRLHLDDCAASSGPMRVLPGSHTNGKLDAGAIASWSARAGELAVDCLALAGDAVVMRPLLLHSSASGTALGHRRVIHLEYAAEALPHGLEWYENGIDANSESVVTRPDTME
jgi:ectoine hydroxylase-related dioxygenase (phytanoyl-CoA dioxygenase family)